MAAGAPRKTQARPRFASSLALPLSRRRHPHYKARQGGGPRHEEADSHGKEHRREVAQGDPRVPGAQGHRGPGGGLGARLVRTAGYKDHDSTFCRPRSKPHRPVMHGAPTTRAPCQSLAQDHSQPSSAMRLRMDSLPSMCIILELYTTRSMTASASAPSPMRSCQPDGPYCEQSISDPLR